MKHYLTSPVRVEEDVCRHIQWHLSLPDVEAEQLIQLPQNAFPGVCRPLSQDPVSEAFRKLEEHALAEQDPDKLSEPLSRVNRLFDVLEMRVAREGRKPQ